MRFGSWIASDTPPISTSPKTNIAITAKSASWPFLTFPCGRNDRGARVGIYLRRVPTRTVPAPWRQRGVLPGSHLLLPVFLRAFPFRDGDLFDHVSALNTCRTYFFKPDIAHREHTAWLEDPGRTQPRAAYPQRRSSNANSLRGRNSARILGIRTSFQRDNLPRHF